MEVADIIVRSVQAFAGVATVAVAIFAATIARGTLEQKRESDERNRWWERTQWALDKFVSEDPLEQVLGATTFEQLVYEAPIEDGEFADKLQSIVSDLSEESEIEGAPSLLGLPSAYTEDNDVERGETDDDDEDDSAQ